MSNARPIGIAAALVQAAALALAGGGAHAAPDAGHFFAVPTVVGEHFSNVYSIAESIKAEGFDERVGRNSGSSDYTLKQASPDRVLTFQETDAYDGAPLSAGEDTIRDQGQTICWNGKCRASTDASGLMYNPLLWGAPPARLRPGVTWRVDIVRPWELGPAGTQTVTVVAVDERNATITLKREGESVGFAANEPAQVKLSRNGRPVTFSVKPGLAHWSGYTTFQRGVILSDELLVVRDDLLESPETGPVKAVRRKYVLLNAAPFPTNG